MNGRINLNTVFSKHAAIAVAFMALTVVACSSAPKPRVDQDSRANFSSYKTFGWMAPKEGDAKAPTANVGTLMGQRVHSSLATAFQSKGLSLNDTQPDVRVSYVLNVYERPKQSGMRIGLGAGGGSGNVAGGVGLSVPVGKRNESVAAMTVDVIDVSRNAQVWTGSFESVIKEKNASDADVQKLVDTILAKYPGR